MNFRQWKRREFHHAAWQRGGGVAAGGARAQPAMPVIGFLNSLGSNDRSNLRDAFRRGLSEAGFVEGRNVGIEYRFAENQWERLPALAADLVGRKIAVIAATGGGASVLAAKGATTTIPIVFVTAGDPVQLGYVASLNRPGGNMTGISWFGALVAGKGLGLLHELVPNAAVIALLTNPKLPESAHTVSDAQKAARTLGRRLLVIEASTPQRYRHRLRHPAATARRRAPARGRSILQHPPAANCRARGARRDPCHVRQPRIRRGGRADELWQDIETVSPGRIHVGRILKGGHPSDLPVDQATTFELVINLRTAKALGIDVPPGLSARADEVIE